MNADLLAGLAERCEAAEGADRHLDVQAFILLDPTAEHIIGHQPGRFPQKAIYGPRSTFWEWACDESREPPIFAVIPEFTASLDAAFTLAQGMERFGGVPGLLREAMDRIYLRPELVSQISPREYAGLLARFFTAACLRARAAGERP